jgi:putative membrane protein
MNDERREWLARPANEQLSRKLGVVAWILTAVVLILVGLMRRPELRIQLPEGWSLSFLPAVHALINTLVSICLVLALLAVRQGRIARHRSFIFAAMGLSTVFLLCYVAYHFTTPEVRYGGEGLMRAIYFFLLVTHIVLAGISLPFILFTFIAGWTNRFTAHRRLARWVYPMWLYVAVTGPICWLMLRPYYG